MDFGWVQQAGTSERPASGLGEIEVLPRKLQNPFTQVLKRQAAATWSTASFGAFVAWAYSGLSG